MFGLIESILLSQFLIFMVIFAMLLVVTSWAFRAREYPGYILGWLVGIFFIIVYRTVTGGETPAPDAVEEIAEAAQSEEIRLSLFAVLIPSLFGLISGFGVLYFLREFGSTRTRRSITIAVLTSIVIIVLYFLATTTQYTGRIIGIFALAFAIGALTTIVIGGGSPRPPRSAPPGGQSGGDDPLPSAQLSATQDRFDRLRRRIERRE
jgi:small-conductance mechanosensitive channel